MTTAHVTAEDCDAALDHIRAAPKDNAAIDHLCFRPESGLRDYPEHLDMTVSGGIKGERWLTNPWLKLPDGAPDPRIQVSILSKRVLDLCWRDRAGTPHPGDPIIVDMDLSHENLPVGTRLAVGTAVLEVSDKRNSGCTKWQAWYGDASLRWINRGPHRDLRLRGALCRIVQDGRVSVGDRLVKL